MERLRAGSFRLYEKAASLGYSLEIQNPGNLGLLRKKPDSPCVIYFNHTASDDPFITLDVLQKEVPERLKNVIMPVSEYYSKFKNHFSYALSVRAGRAIGLTMPEIVQAYRNRNEMENKGEGVNILNLKFKRLLEDRMGEGLTVIISPEGHRSESGKLIPAEGGVGLIAKIMEKNKKGGRIENGYFIPLAIIYEKDGSGIHYNAFNKEGIKVTVGKALEASEVIAEAKSLAPGPKLARVSSHVMMRHLAEILPEQSRGFYSDEYYADILNGRYESRMDEEGNVYIFDNEKSEIVA